MQMNTSGANSVKFPDSPAENLFSQITTDLYRFTKTGIHIDMVEQPYCSEREPSMPSNLDSLPCCMSTDFTEHHSLNYNSEK